MHFKNEILKRNAMIKTPNPPYRLALLSPSRELAAHVKTIMRERSEEMRYEYVDFETGPILAKACLVSGSEVVICHGGTGNAIIRALGHSVVIIDRTDMDVIKALKRARLLSKNVILSAYRDERHDLEEMEALLDLKIQHIAYDTQESLFKEIRRQYGRGNRVLVGGGVSKQYMESLGGKGFLIETNQHSVLLALDRAIAMARQKREENMRHADIVMILKQLQEGVICIDGDGRLIFSNALAFQMLRLKADATEEHLTPYYAPLGLLDVLRNMQPKLDTVVEIAGESFVVRAFPLTMHGAMRCAVAFFRDVPSLQKINRKIGEELYAKGFVARTGLDDIIGKSPKIVRLKEKILRYAASDAAVLISGETGTGKELTAHALHQESARRAKPFVAVNFASLPPNLMESELFGYEDGAFTGAKRGGKMGLFEMADRGTLFLDEVGEISHEMQLRLLRVLEAREVMRVGGSRIFPVDVRVISASHRPLLELVMDGRFRQDLYYRLSTLKLATPPLRERSEDIPLLLEKLLRRSGKPDTVISPYMIELLGSYHWPGNIRELLALVEGYLILLDSLEPDAALFHAILQENSRPIRKQNDAAPTFNPSLSLKENLEVVRADFVRKAVEHHKGDRAMAAHAMGISPSTLWRILR